MNIEDRMLDTAQADSGSTNQLIMSLENLVQSVQLTDEAFSVVSENIGIAISEVEESDVINGLTFLSRKNSSINYEIVEGVQVVNNESIASSLVLPRSLIRLIFEGNYILSKRKITEICLGTWPE